MSGFRISTATSYSIPQKSSRRTLSHIAIKGAPGGATAAGPPAPAPASPSATSAPSNCGVTISLASKAKPALGTARGKAGIVDPAFEPMMTLSESSAGEGDRRPEPGMTPSAVAATNGSSRLPGNGRHQIDQKKRKRRHQPEKQQIAEAYVAKTLGQLGGARARLPQQRLAVSAGASDEKDERGANSGTERRSRGADEPSRT